MSESLSLSRAAQVGSYSLNHLLLNKLIHKMLDDELNKIRKCSVTSIHCQQYLMSRQ